MIQAIKISSSIFSARNSACSFCSMLPIIELRGSIPLGAALDCRVLELHHKRDREPSPVPAHPASDKKRYWNDEDDKGVLEICALLEAKAEKNKGKLERACSYGLLLFVAIPIPGTGAWTAHCSRRSAESNSANQCSPSR
jgi:hypothetical protein